MNDIFVWIFLGACIVFLVWLRWRVVNSISKPIVDVRARVARILGKIGPIRLGRTSSFKTIPGCYITFEILSGDENGKKRTFYVDDHIIENVSLEDIGILTFQGARFLRFEPEN